MLNAHLDKHFAAYIRAGLTHGFHVSFDSRANMLKSASRSHLKQGSIVTDYINTKVSVGRLVGPIPETTVREVQIRKREMEVVLCAWRGQCLLLWVCQWQNTRQRVSLPFLV